MFSASNTHPIISTYALYSEEPSFNDPEFFHIEDIKSRARLFMWHASYFLIGLASPDKDKCVSELVE